MASCRSLLLSVILSFASAAPLRHISVTPEQYQFFDKRSAVLLIDMQEGYAPYLGLLDYGLVIGSQQEVLAFCSRYDILVAVIEYLGGGRRCPRSVRSATGFPELRAS